MLAPLNNNLSRPINRKGWCPVLRLHGYSQFPFRWRFGKVLASSRLPFSHHCLARRRACHRQARVTAASIGLLLLFAMAAQASLDSAYELSPVFCDGVDDVVAVVPTSILPRDKMKDLVEHGKALVLSGGEVVRAASLASLRHVPTSRPPTFHGRLPAPRSIARRRRVELLKTRRPTPTRFALRSGS